MSGSGLLADYAASDAIARISRWICLHVVGTGMNHNCSPAIGKHRMRIGSIAEIYIVVS